MLGEPDPAFDADPDDRWKIDRGPPTSASLELRRGLLEAMVALGVYPAMANGVGNASHVSAMSVRKLFAQPEPPIRGGIV